jgi:hypothetical protein
MRATALMIVSMACAPSVQPAAPAPAPAPSHQRPSDASRVAPEPIVLHGKGPDCEVEILTDASSIASVETWRSLTNRLANEADLERPYEPESEADARQQLCGARRCQGSGPWIVGLSNPANEQLEYLAVVMPRPDGTLATLMSSWYSNVGWECNHKNRLSAVQIGEGQALQVRVERSNGVGEWHSCADEHSFDGCVEYCREATMVTYDWLLEPETVSTLAVIVRVKSAGPGAGREFIDEIPDASEVGGVVELVVDGPTIAVIGCGLETRLSL